MLTSITPLGERGRQQRWVVTATTYALGSAAAGAAFGAALGAIGSVTLAPVAAHESRRTLALAALGVLALAGLVLDARTGARPPSIHRQVNENWLARYRGWVYGAGFGAQLGLGVVTIVTTASLYVAFAAAFLSASPLGGLLVGAAFGTARAIPIALARDVHDVEALRTLMRAVDRARPAAGATVAAGLATTAAIAAALAIAGAAA